MPLPLIAGGIAIGSGIASIFSNKAQSDAVQEAIKRAKALAAQGLISQDDLADRLNSIDRSFNQRLTSTLNTTAIRSRGLANRGTVGAAVAGNVEGARLSAQENAIGQAQTINTQIRSQIAGIELQGLGTGADPVGSFVEGAAAALPLVNEGAKFLGDRPVGGLPDTPPGGAGAGTGTAGPNRSGAGGLVPIENAGNFNPFLRQQGQRFSNAGGTGSDFSNLDFLPNVRFP